MRHLQQGARPFGRPGSFSMQGSITCLLLESHRSRIHDRGGRSRLTERAPDPLTSTRRLPPAGELHYWIHHNCGATTGTAAIQTVSPENITTATRIIAHPPIGAAIGTVSHTAEVSCVEASLRAAGSPAGRRLANPLYSAGGDLATVLLIA
jgi:hypothetical protein